ncbi:MAG: hypothetical protein SVY41_00080 [Candidatus Nanohaloarchaea archaeon]|nr:hypothetical protein [Candidatus Nanohaloarchaea archaeon]
MFERLKAQFKDPITVEPGNAHDRFREEKAGELEQAAATVEDITADVEDALAELDERLQELEGYEDVEGRDVVEDVTENIVAERRRMVDRFSVPDRPQELYEALDSFCNDFREMKRKETEVLKVLGDEKNPVFDALDTVKGVRDRLSSFLQTEYPVLERSSDLEEACSRLSQLRQRRDELSGELAEIDLASVREEIDAVEAELDGLHSSEEWTTYQELQDQLGSAEAAMEEPRNTVSAAANRMERGLKKLLYGPENRDAPLEHRPVLEDIRDGDVDVLLERDPAIVEAAVMSAVDALPDDLLGERQHDKFTAAADTLADIGEVQEELAERRERVQQLEEQVDSHPAPQQENELAAQLDDLKAELEEKRQRRKELRDRKGQVDTEIGETEERIRGILADAFAREIEMDRAE